MDISRHPRRPLTGENPVIDRIVGPIRICLGGMPQYLNLTNGAAYTVQRRVKGIQNLFPLVFQDRTVCVKENIITKINKCIALTLFQFHFAFQIVLRNGLLEHIVKIFKIFNLF